ncbi:MAG: TonB-dependent receptor [Pseudomonadota bacterium]
MRKLMLLTVSAAALAHGAQAQDEGPIQTDIIVVTGEKRERSLQDTNASVAVFGSEALEAQNLLNVADALELVAGVNTTQEGRGYSIRGANATFTQTVDAGIVGNAPLSSIIVDGVTLPAFQTQGGPTRAWDIAQVEVFRGPQSTVIGRNAMTGAIVVRTQSPVFETEGKAQIQIGEYGRRQYALMLNTPLTDTLAGRIAIERFEEEGDISNPFLGIDDQDFVDQINVRGKLLYESEAHPFSALLTVNWIDSEEGFGGVYDADNRFGVPNPDPFLREGWNNTPVDDDRTTQQAILEINYDLSDAWSVASITAYSFAELFGRKDGDSGPILSEENERNREETQWSQEVRFNYEGDRLDGVMGFFAFRSDFDLENYFELGDIFTARDGGVLPSAEALFYSNPAVGLPSSLIPALNAVTPELIEIQTGDQNDYANTNFAVYADFDYQFAPGWTVSLGARIDYQEYEYERFGAFSRLNQSEVDAYLAGVTGVLLSAPGFPGGAVASVVDALETDYVNGLFNAVAPLLGSGADGVRTGDNTAFLPKAGVTYDITDDVSLAFTVQRSYRTGGVSFQASSGLFFPYDPEYAWNYEASFRSSWFGDNLFVNANVYFVDWTDQQVAFQEDLSDPFSAKTVNAGESEVRGVELEVLSNPLPGLSLAASVAYNDTEFLEFDTGTNDFSGNPFGLAPEWTAGVQVSYLHDSGFFASANASYVDDRFQFERATHALEAYTLANAQAGFEFDPIRLAVNVSNLFDEEYLTQNRSTVFSSVGNPRTVSVTATLSW